MAELTDGLWTAVCVMGLACLGWWLMGKLLCPVPSSGTWVVLEGKGEGDGLEQRVRAFFWLRSLGLLRCPVVIVDAGLDKRGREVAHRLALRWSGVVLWSEEVRDPYI